MTSEINNTVDNRFKRVVELTHQTIESRIESEIGFTDDLRLIQLLNEGTIKFNLKPLLKEYVVHQLDSEKCIKELLKIVSGSKMYDMDLDWSVKDLVFNLYQHYDATYNMYMAFEFKMKFFIYQGGVIGDSRDFCTAHNNKVWSMDEAENWGTWTPSQGDYRASYNLKSTSKFEVLSYLNYPGYQPLIDRGGYNCRHMLGWISDEQAFDLRPDLSAK